MKIVLKRIKGIGTGFAVVLLAAGPAVADDTELLLSNPDPSSNPKPNVMFILDSSGSMGDEVETTNPYDPLQDYPGDCLTDHIYWTDVDVVPDCTVTTNFVHDDDFVCEYADRQIAGIGSFTNTMVQYRDGGPDGTTSGPERWQYLAPGYNSHQIECQADSGDHGDGDATRLWASNGTDLSEPFTNDESMEVSWGSAPRNISYTVFDGNYINWKNDPELVDLSKSFIMKTVATKVLSSVDNLNVGLMRFDGNDGGPVILDITDLDDNRQDVLDAVDAIPAGGNTPLSETMFEAALYWRGLPARYGSSTMTTLTDLDALAVATAGAEVYEQPEWDTCAKNYNVLLSDGRPVEDFDPPGILTDLPGIAGVLGYAGCDGPVLTDGGQCLDDIAEYLSKDDVDTDEDDDQLVVTHTIGFDIDLPILEETALNSGGQYFLADDVESLTKTLLSIIANINDRSLSFTAPAVSVNTFNRTRTFNDLYITTFGARSRAHWPGNLKKYRILNSVIVDENEDAAVDPDTGFFVDTAQSIWTPDGTQDGNNVRAGGAAGLLPIPTDRNLYTDISGSSLYTSSNHVSTSNMGQFTLADFGLTGAAGEPSMDELIRWARGEDLLDEDNNTATNVRKAMGDPLHSQPAAVVYGGTAAAPEVVVYTATNDGYLHAIDGATGEELWAYIPESLLGNLTRLYFDPAAKYKQYGLDGNIVPIVRDVDDDGIIESGDGDFVIIIFGMRRGGNDYFALNVTDKTQPELLWKTTLPQAGESWSTPVVARVKIGDGSTQNALNAVVVIGGGYDVVHDTNAHPVDDDSVGTGVHFLDLISGAPLWRAGEDSSADTRLDESGREMNRAIPNEIRVIDLNGDQLADRMYATDLGGQVWRFDITNGNDVDELVAGGIIARLGAEGTSNPSAAETRRFYNAPDVSLVTDAEQQRRYISVSVGSGYRAHPFDLSAADRFYSVRDPDVFNLLPQNDYNNYDIAEDGDLVEVSGQVNTVVTSSDRGWKFTLPANQKVLSDSITFNDEVLFVAFSPESVPGNSCISRGTNYLYRMSAVNGDPIVPNLDTLDPNDSDAERVKLLKQGGIAPSPAVLFPTPEADCDESLGECDPEPLYCVGVECEGTGFGNNPVRTLWTQDGIE